MWFIRLHVPIRMLVNPLVKFKLIIELAKTHETDKNLKVGETNVGKTEYGEC